ncbi:MAG: hypothetical protein EAZ55_10395 [Cytophagales bacterium]|nr:MAG: hypothetical protein EAZ55_10395 [Cytophagales bacterium]
MKSILLSFLFIISFAAWSQAQISAEEKKSLQLEIKTFGRNLPTYKAFKDSVNTMNNRLNLIKTDATKIASELAKKRNEVRDKEAAIQALQVQIAELEKNKGSNTGSGRNIVFKLQIAAFEKNSQLGSFLEKYPKFVLYETDPSDNMKKYTIGYFRHYFEAKQLEKFLTDMGAKVFVVGYENGKRVNDIKKLTDGYL